MGVETVMPAYCNAKEILPADLVAALQKYAAGMQLYVPCPGETRAAWGSRNGTRQDLEHRNHQIRQLYQQGVDLEEIACRFHLSRETVRKIVRGVRRQWQLIHT